MKVVLIDMSNTCTTVEQGLTGCCCNTDACVAPWRSPTDRLYCYVGMYAPKAGINTGAEVPCNLGKCASIRAMVNSDDVTIFTCMANQASHNRANSITNPGNPDFMLVRSKPGNVLWCYVGLSAPKAGINVGGEVVCDGQCSSLSAIINGDNVTTFQCAPTTICRSTPQRHHLYRSIIVCVERRYSTTCFGECGSVTMQTTMNGQAHNATVYMCDPTAVCQALNMSNTCMSMEVGLSGCCCNEDACLTPTKSPLNNPLTCYVGLNAPKAGINVGAEVVCNGMCSSLNAIVNGDNVTTFQCVSRSVCKSFGLGVGYGCQTLRGDREVTGCCCDNGNGCNLAARPDIIQPTLAPYVEFPISCWSGVYVNGVPLSRPGYQSCNGECASLTLVTTINQVTHNATMYTCDPSSVCKALKMYNQCTTLETGLSGCCCDTDACLNPTRVPGRPLWCYVGLIAKKAGVNVGAEVACNGMCSSLSGKVNGDDVTTFQCVPNRVCKTFLNTDGCATLQGDREITGCCCRNADSCNVAQLNRTDTCSNQGSTVAAGVSGCYAM
ncbi:ET module [Cooperia oncophora]